MNHESQTNKRQGWKISDEQKARGWEAEFGESPLRLSPQEESRFWSRIDKNGPTVRPGLTRCWIWTHRLSKCGYGNFSLRGKSRRAHRVSFCIKGGEWAVMILHHCDNRKCVNPEHLFAGDLAANNQDRILKDRTAKGSAVGNSKLTEEVVHFMRTNYQPTRRYISNMARQFMVDSLTVSRAIFGVTWKHVSPVKDRERLRAEADKTALAQAGLTIERQGDSGV